MLKLMNENHDKPSLRYSNLAHELNLTTAAYYSVISVHPHARPSPTLAYVKSS